mmetsp:Transcript_43044/g.84871  ORF Transcript_43044/g.84871 Transcript_43044/m.84871 type:complete len:227 (-) Transcript_43044:12-692(-)
MPFLHSDPKASMASRASLSAEISSCLLSSLSSNVEGLYRHSAFRASSALRRESSSSRSAVSSCLAASFFSIEFSGFFLITSYADSPLDTCSLAFPRLSSRAFFCFSQNFAWGVSRACAASIWAMVSLIIDRTFSRASEGVPRTLCFFDRRTLPWAQERSAQRTTTALVSIFAEQKHGSGRRTNFFSWGKTASSLGRFLILCGSGVYTGLLKDRCGEVDVPKVEMVQ